MGSRGVSVPPTLLLLLCLNGKSYPLWTYKTNQPGASKGLENQSDRHARSRI